VQELEDEEEEVMETTEKALQSLKSQMDKGYENLAKMNKNTNERIAKMETTLSKIAAHLFKEETKEIDTQNLGN
jgi:hypothetical protein